MLQLKKFPNIPVSTREKARESSPHPEEPRFRLLAGEEGSFPCVVGKDFLVFPSHLKRRRSPQERREELQGRATILRDPRCLSLFQGNMFSLHCLDFQAEDRLTPRWHVGQPCGKASWERLLGKLRWKAPDPLIHAKGSVTLLLKLGRKAHVHAPTRDEDCLPWGDCRSTPGSMSALERNPQVLAPIHTMSYGPASKGEESRVAPEQLAWGLAFPEATRAGP